MNGTITFNSIEEMAQFLKEFVGSTAVFEAYRCDRGFDNSCVWVVEFKGGF